MKLIPLDLEHVTSIIPSCKANRRAELSSPHTNKENEFAFQLSTAGTLTVSKQTTEENETKEH